VSATAASGRAVPLALTLRGKLDAAAIGCWLAAFGLVAYLGLRGGGYDPLVRGEVGVALWWIVLVGAAAGVLPAARLRWAAWAGIGLLAAFGAWTLLSVSWSESSERSVAEAARVAAYAAVLVVGLAAQGRSAARHLVHGVAAAIVLVAAVAVLSRLQPQLFGPSAVDRFFPFIANRLSYPLGYWNLLAALAAMAIPLLLGIAARARWIGFQALAAGAIPILVLCAYLTTSRGAVGFVAVGLIAWLVLAPDRLAALATAALAAAGSALVIGAADQREALQANLRDAAHMQQGNELLAFLVVVCLGVALVQVAISLLARHARRPRALVLPRRHAPAAFGAVALAAVVAFLAVGGPGFASDQWKSFKVRATGAEAATTGAADPFSRLQAGISGNGRYGHWLEAIQAQESAPLLGIGPGAFEFWTSRNPQERGSFVRDAHMLYLETFGELGLVGAALLLALFALILVAGAIRAVRAVDPARQAIIAAATAGCATFMAAATVEWAWEMTVLPVAMLLLAAVVLGPDRDRWRADPDPEHEATDAPGLEGVRGPLAWRARRLAPRVALCAIAAAGLLVTTVPLAATGAVRDSRAAAADGRLGEALTEARTAAAVQPYAATPELQRALLLERAGRLEPAAAAATEAARAEPTNWRTWLIRARILATAGEAREAVSSYERARSLNPQSTLWNQLEGAAAARERP